MTNDTFHLVPNRGLITTIDTKILPASVIQVQTKPSKSCGIRVLRRYNPVPFKAAMVKFPVPHIYFLRHNEMT